MHQPNAQDAWETLAEVYATSRHVSADQLIEWPAQLAMCGDFKGKRILDVGCGTGDKAHFFADQGACSVTGVDPSRGFAEHWKRHARCTNLSLAIGDFETLSKQFTVPSQPFDLIVSFQALMYASDLKQALKTLRNLVSANGAIVLSVPHPFRFAILKHEIEGWGFGQAYQHTAPYRYPSPWKDDVLLEHAMPRVCDYTNAITAAGFTVESMEEPCVTQAFRALTPEKAAWMDHYIGILIVRARADNISSRTSDVS